MKPQEILTIEQATGETFRHSGKEVNGIIWGTSFYLNLRGKKIRVSDHRNTSKKYEQAVYNFLYSEMNDVINVVKQLQSIEMNSYEVDVLTPIFSNISEINIGTYNTERGIFEITAINNDVADCTINGVEKQIKLNFVMNWREVKKEVRFIK